MNNEHDTQETKHLGDAEKVAARRERITKIFEAASVLTGKEREEFLKESCGDDAEMRTEVEKLLKSFEDSESFMQNPPVAEAVSMFEEKKTLIGKNTTGNVERGSFRAGTVLASRYRIIGMIGRGGMGEVYKAEDIKLSQTVALKFLPDDFQKDSAALERFHAEVRNARQVSHVNVCRVFDIGEIDGKHFLSMEFIDGDDLSSLLRRVGRLSSERAIEIARQLCVGLAAIHNAGILHRDFKPANVIIDSKGKARITDFGIAGVEAEIAKDNLRVGTPAYMSPEQIAGKDVSAKSDIYALGLVLYEIFTGKQAFQADSIPELIRKQTSETPTNPSEFVKGLDPLVESVISQCIQKNPKDRPQSALHVAMTLPGGNPLQIALDAGQTPSPEMVAASPVKGALKPWVALSLLIGFVVAFSLVLYLRSIYATNAYAPLDKPPVVLAERAKAVIKDLGYADVPQDTDYKFVEDWDYSNFVKEQDDPRSWFEKLRTGQPANYFFRFRQSPDYMQTINGSPISADNPPMTVPGMVTAELDVTGRLTAFTAVPPAQFSHGDPSQKTDWKKLFDAAGLDITTFKPSELKRTPPVAFDETAAWEGTMAGNTDIPVRIEAAAFNARPVYFNIVPSWKEPEGEVQQKAKGNRSLDALTIFLVSFFVLSFVGAILLVRHNLKNGRGDLTGAAKLGAFCLVIYLLKNLLIYDAPPTFVGMLLFLISSMAWGLFVAALAFVYYLSVEPFVRRRWPEVLISWSRLVIGQFRDPMIGRDILIGVFIAVAGILASYALEYFQFTRDPKVFFYLIKNTETDHLQGAAGAISDILDKLRDSMVWSFLWLFLLLIMTLIFRKKLLGVIAVAILAGLLIFSGILQDPWSVSVARVLYQVCFLFLLVRVGLVAFASFYMIGLFFLDSAFTLDPSSFYFPSTVIMSATALALAGYAYYVSLAGKKIFGDGNFFGE